MFTLPKKNNTRSYLLHKPFIQIDQNLTPNNYQLKLNSLHHKNPISLMHPSFTLSLNEFIKKIISMPIH